MGLSNSAVGDTQLQSQFSYRSTGDGDILGNKKLC